MSNLFAAGSSRDQGRALPRGEVVGRYTAYLDAQKAVDYLADSKFAVQNVSIVGNDLKTVERVTGRLSYPRVALSSALTGAWFGLFVGLVLSLFGGGEALVSIGPIIALGAVFWLLFGVIGYALQRGRRDFTSTSQVVATTYDVIVAPEVAGEARRLLAQLPMNGQAGHPVSPQGQPGPYGQQGQPGPYGQQGQPGPYGQQGPYGALGQQPRPGQAPERPAGWHDPYSSPAPAGPADPAGGPAPANPQGPADGSQPAPRRGQIPDLPDGRPQYGVRLDAEGRPIQPRPAGATADTAPARDDAAHRSDAPAEPRPADTAPAAVSTASAGSHEAAEADAAQEPEAGDNGSRNR